MGFELRLIWCKVFCVLFHLKFCLGFMILAQFEKPTWADNMSRNSLVVKLSPVKRGTANVIADQNWSYKRQLCDILKLFTMQK